MCSLYTALPLTVAFAKDFDIPKSIATLNGVVFSITYSVSCLFYGTISEKIWSYSYHFMWLSGLSHYLLSDWLCAVIYLINYSTCTARHLCCSIFSVSITYVTENYSPVKRVTAISFISTSFMLSGVIGQNL